MLIKEKVIINIFIKFNLNFLLIIYYYYFILEKQKIAQISKSQNKKQKVNIKDEFQRKIQELEFEERKEELERKKLDNKLKKLEIAQKEKELNE